MRDKITGLRMYLAQKYENEETLDKLLRLGSLLIVALVVVIIFDVYDYRNNVESGIVAENTLYTLIVNTAINLSLIGLVGSGVANIRRKTDGKDNIPKVIPLFFTVAFVLSCFASVLI